MKNHQSRPPGSAPISKVNATIVNYLEKGQHHGRGRGHGRSRGRGSNRGRGPYNKNFSSYKRT